MANQHEDSMVVERLTDGEPAFTLAGRDVRRRARRVRARRRLAAGAACVLVAGFAVGGAVALQQFGTADSAPAPAVGDSFDPDALASSIVDAIEAEVSQASTAMPVSVDVVAQDAQGNPISGADRDKATLWTATLVLSSTDRLELSLVNQRTSLDQANQACAGELADGLSLSCDVTTAGDTVVLTQIRAVRRQDGAWPIVFVDKLSSANTGALWFQRRVVATSPGGSAVMVNEFVRAPTLQAAEAAWTLSTDGLTDIATNESLTFPHAAAGDGCGWIVPEHTDEITCGS